MDIFLIILGSICLLVGLAGCIVPMLPGPPVSYLALVFLHFTDKVSFTIPQLFFWLFIVVLIQILDYFIPMFGVKRLGGTPWGKWGCIIGTFAGIFLFAPLGRIYRPVCGRSCRRIIGWKRNEIRAESRIRSICRVPVGHRTEGSRMRLVHLLLYPCPRIAKLSVSLSP